MVQFFKENLSKDSELAPAVAGVNTLTQVIKQSKGSSVDIKYFVFKAIKQQRWWNLKLN